MCHLTSTVPPFSRSPALQRQRVCPTDPDPIGSLRALSPGLDGERGSAPSARSRTRIPLHAPVGENENKEDAPAVRHHNQNILPSPLPRRVAPATAPRQKSTQAEARPALLRFAMATANHHQPTLARTRRWRSEVRCSTSPAQEFAALASVFRRRLVVGASTAAAAAVGANFGGVTSFLLGLSPELGRSLRLDVLYPVGGFTRCLDSDNGFEFIYPANWVGDQTILYNQIKKAELQRSLDPPPLSNGRLSRPPNISGPVAAFGPPGSNGELNVSVIVSPVPQDFSIESFGGPKDVGEVVLRRIARTKRNPDISATLIGASLREDATNNVKYYKLEFCVESPSFRRHNVAVCCVRDGRLYTLNAQAPESAWKAVQKEFFAMADSFSLVVDA